MNNRLLLGAALLALVVATSKTALQVAAQSVASPRAHHVAFQVDEAGADRMNQVLNNIDSMYAAYQEHDEPVEIELVAFGPGLAMLRDDASPVKPRLAAERAAHPALVLSACENTRRAMSRAEGKEIALVAEARPVPSGVVRLTQLQEAGWTYLRP